MKVRRVLALLVAVLLLSGMVIPASAAVAPETASLQYVCTECASNFTVSTCYGAPGLVATGDCSTSGCTIRYYKRTGGEYCNECDKIVEVYGRHDCYRVHSSCGKGTVNTCPMDWTPSPGYGDYWS